MRDAVDQGHGGALGREELSRLLHGQRPLVAGLISIEAQLQPNGIDLSVSDVGRFMGGGAIGQENFTRVLPEIQPMSFDAAGWLDLSAGPYQIVFNETVALPNDIMALGRPRSSLCRMGATISTAVWDAGYSGRSTALLIVENPAGVRLQRNARLLQLVFFTLNTPTARGYDGAYQGENLVGDALHQSRRA